MASTPEKFWEDLETSLRLLQTDYIDVYQLHNPPVCPKPGDETGCTTPCWRQRNREKSGLSAITNHRIDVAEEAVESGLYDTLQFPFNYLSTERERAWQRNAGKRIWDLLP